MTSRRGQSVPPGSVTKRFSSQEEIDYALRKLRRRVEQVRALDPDKIRYDDAAVSAAEADIHSTILEIFGPASPEALDLGHIPIWKGSMGVNMPDSLMQSRFADGIPFVATRLEALVQRLEEDRLEMLEPVSASSRDLRPRRIFIGHGRSHLWRQLDEFLTKRLHLETDEFNRESPAGLSHKERLHQMLASTSFAFLVMTAEDEHADGTRHARENVIHEIGLFQGRHGFERAIVLAEEGCAEFSNIQGLNQIRFPAGDLLARSEQIRQVLEREGLLS